MFTNYYSTLTKCYNCKKWTNIYVGEHPKVEITSPNKTKIQYTCPTCNNIQMFEIGAFTQSKAIPDNSIEGQIINLKRRQ